MSEREALVRVCQGMIDIVERVGCKDWRDEHGRRLKDAKQWVEFYVAVNRAAERAALTDPQQEPVAESHCVWMQDSDGPWNTSCGHVFEFTDGGPHQNDAAWCQYCGGKLLPTYHDGEQESVERNAALLAAAKEQK